MIRGFLFAATTLLLPCLAFSATSPTADLSIQVIPSSPSGSTPPAPAGAAAAGFTTLALNTDWEHQTFPTNWMGGCPTGNIPVNTDNAQGEKPLVPYGQDNSGHTWYANIWWSYGDTGCDYMIVPDPVYGNNALDLAFNNRNNSYDHLGNVIETVGAGFNRSTGAGQANTFPIGSYYEITYRLSPLDTRSYLAFYTWGQDGVWDSNCACALEWDAIETSGGDLGAYDSAVHLWGGGSPGGWILFPWTSLAAGTNFDTSNYNTIGLRVTYNSASNTAVGCTYINNVFQTCSALETGLSAGETGIPGRNFLIIQKGCADWQGSCTIDLQRAYIKSVRVWSCASWQTTQCAGTVLSAAP